MTPSSQWRPTAPLSVLRKRADIFYQIRDFFRNRQVMEVDTPVLGHAGVSDPHIQNFQTVYQAISGNDQPTIRFLQTSPEYAMKRLLADSSGSIYQLGKVFRDEVVSPQHQPEFTLLEWYRVDWNDEQLIKEVKELISLILGEAVWTHVTYKDLFMEIVNLNPHSAAIEELQHAARQMITYDVELFTKAQWLDLLFSHMIEPALKKMGRVVITEYPQNQAGLAQIFVNPAGDSVSKRFEIYIDGLELANGYQELQDEREQRIRFEQDQQIRERLKLPMVEPDEDLLSAMRAGLPSCAGVALGVDRLIMLSVGATHIAHTMPFGELGNQHE